LLKQEFVDDVKRSVIWIDHHAPEQLHKVTLFQSKSPQKRHRLPITNVCYDLVKEDLWIAMVGCIGDWHMPHFKDAFCKEYPVLWIAP
jgi:hemoglobin-like flavoprotein